MENEPKLPAKSGYVTPFNEIDAAQALIEARGDIFVAAQLLCITSIRLHRAIKMSVVLQATIEEITKTPVNKSLADSQIHQAVEERLGLYRVAGLDALHDLATMPIDPNSAQNQVKLAAAARLAGSTDVGAGGGEMGETLRELRDLYESHAPRLRVVREHTKTTVEVMPSDPVAIVPVSDE